jgi:serine/threonine protein phosphatase PrpC
MKKHQNICGDAFKFKKLRDENRVIAVLSDGLGSGVKANILASMTAVMALKFTSNHKEIVQSAEIIMGALPICQVRKISYATFTIVDSALRGRTRIIEMGNPAFQLFRNGLRQKVTSRQLHSDNWKDRELEVYDFDVQTEDRLILFSDGVTQAGMGTPACQLGWRESGCQNFIEETLRDNGRISAHELSTKIINQALEHEPGRISHDDMTCSVIYFRHPRKLMLLTGPPFDREKDAEYVKRLAEFDGQKVICGGTTAEITARQLKREINMNIRGLRSELPPTSKIEGIDLVTEGIFTLTKTAQYLEKETISGIKDPAGQLVDLLLDNDIIEFMVGTRINEAHQDPNLPVDIELRRNIIKRIAESLKDKYLKEVKIQFV